MPAPEPLMPLLLLQAPTPQNGGYMVAAYVVAAVIYLGYTLTLRRRAKRALRE
ncbi:MAG TPA: hypothetical protein VFS40_04070 [Gemmatimonadales bacterium]|nr:hypothetical protein [Gemmatimonadales bacterium]